MGLLSIFKRADVPRTTAAGEPADAVLRARTRARQRLVGAAILVVIGIVGFPLVFESQPRPIPVDIPIEVPRKEGAPALVMPAARATAANSSASPVAAAPAAAPGDVITETRDEAGREVTTPSPAPASSATPKAEIKAPVKPPIVAVAEPAPKPEAKPATTANDAARARVLLDGKLPTAHSEGGRFIVQVGAFSDAGAARETRLKVEKLGMKTYTQVASTASGNRIRVRVGPFGTRDEADKAMAKAKGAGLSAVVLTL